MKRKRILSLLLTLVLFAGLCPPLAARAVTGGKLIAVTFDDGPSAYTDRLLDGLKARGVKATFFMVGQYVARYPQTVARVYREGHQIANHSYSHANLVNLSDNDVKYQIQSVNDLLYPICGAGTQFLVRAPYGSTNARVRSLIGAPLVYWSVDPEDWKYRNATTVCNNLVKAAYDGSILLVHDSHSTSVDGVLKAIDILQGQGYEFVTVHELFRRRGVAMQNGVSHVSCKPNGTDLGPVQAPVITGTVKGSKIEVTITAQSGADIYYSTSSDQFNQESTKYTGPITLTPPFTLYSVAAFNMNGSRSEVTSKSFTQIPSVAPVLNYSNGTVTITNMTPGSNIYYTTNGTPSTDKYYLYDGSPVQLQHGMTIRACSGGDVFLTSPEVSGYYTSRDNFFRDVFPGSWYYDSVDQIVQFQIMQGAGDCFFLPDKEITWGEVLTMLYRQSGHMVTEEELANLPETLHADGKYYRDAAAWAYANILIDAYVPMEQAITRQSLAVLLTEYLEAQGRVLPEADNSVYADEDAIAPAARDAIAVASTCGLIQGDEHGEFHPAEGATRAQAATVMLRLISVEADLPLVSESETPEAST